MHQVTRFNRGPWRNGPATMSSRVAACLVLAACKDKVVEMPPASSPVAQSTPVSAPATPAPAQAPVPVSASTPVASTAAPRSIPMAVQGVAAAGVTVRVKGIEIGVDATVLDVSISFANRITSSTMLALLDTFLEDENGTRLPIKRPVGNRDLTINEGETLNGTLVFMGAVPASARKLRLVFNESNADDNIVAPGFKVELPLSGG